jgi:hypothetical protein
VLSQRVDDTGLTRLQFQPHAAKPLLENLLTPLESSEVSVADDKSSSPSLTTTRNREETPFARRMIRQRRPVLADDSHALGRSFVESHLRSADNNPRFDSLPQSAEVECRCAPRPHFCGSFQSRLEQGDGHPETVCQAVANYVALVPNAIRQSQRRPFVTAP